MRDDAPLLGVVLERLVSLLEHHHTVRGKRFQEGRQGLETADIVGSGMFVVVAFGKVEHGLTGVALDLCR